jgi:hypothetical protein
VFVWLETSLKPFHPAAFNQLCRITGPQGPIFFFVTTAGIGGYFLLKATRWIRKQFIPPKHLRHLPKISMLQMIGFMIQKMGFLDMYAQGNRFIQQDARLKLKYKASPETLDPIDTSMRWL